MSDKLNIEEVDVPVEITKHALAMRSANDILIQVGIATTIAATCSLASGSTIGSVATSTVSSGLAGAAIAGVVYGITRAECDLRTGKEAKTVEVSSKDIKQQRDRAILLGTAAGTVVGLLKIVSNLNSND